MWGRLLIFSWGLSWPTATAAPWTQEDGGLYSRIAISNEVVEGLQGWRTDAYSEYGLNPDWTVTAKLDRIAYPDASDFDASGWRATLRHSLFRAGPWVSAIEVGAVGGEALIGRTGCSDLGGEMRLGFGWSGDLRSRQSFAFAELAGRFHQNCTHQRYALGFGQQIEGRLWSITQVWLDRSNRGTRSDKFQSEFLWQGQRFDYAVGYRNENGGDFMEAGVFVALARQF